ncbi:MAG: RNA 2',3'-cyclic phosphodiesterase [Candidatus Doudnabacteria bacterium]|nr:RNA 2',3'-cyclic phosphodiesterase [Candidatus Doudnabacteria bacterium]
MTSRMLFAALTFDARSVARLLTIQHDLPLPRDMFRLIGERMLHLTLAYYGPTQPEREKRILETLTTIRRHQTPQLRVDSVLLLPSRTSPRVVTLGVEATEALTSLNELAQIEASDAFLPHVTLARLTSSALEGHPLRLQPHIRALSTYNIEPFSLYPETVTLFESVRKGDTTYVPITVYPLS